MVEVSDGILLALEERFYPVSKAMYVLMSRPDGLELASALGVLVMAILGVTFFVAEGLSRPAAPPSFRVRSKPRSASLTLIVAAILSALLLRPGTAQAETDELVLVSSHWEGIKHEFGAAFSKQWREQTGREISLRWLDIGGTSDIIKYVRGQFKATPSGIGIDLVFGGGVDSFLELAGGDVLASAPISGGLLATLPQSLSGAPLRDSKNRWFAVALSTFGIVCNKVAAAHFKLPLPSRWSDLARPEYFGLIGAADPRKSGSMHAIYEVILQGYGWQRGWEIIRGLGANVRVFSGSAMQVAKDLSTAEILCAVSIDTHAGDAIRKMGADRVWFILPSYLRPVNGDGIAMLRGAPNRTAAIRFIEFLLSPAGQRIWYGRRGSPGGPQAFEIGKLPVRPDIYGSIESAAITEGSPFDWPHVLAYDPALASRRWVVVNDLFGSFVIDVHSQLRKVAKLGGAVSGLSLSEEEITQLTLQKALGAGGGLSVTQRSELLNRFAALARSEFPGRSFAEQLLFMLPSLMLLLLLVVATYRRSKARLMRVFDRNS
jgi:ABC-type Fe3+ transport system substrate-binding protein